MEPRCNNSAVRFYIDYTEHGVLRTVPIWSEGPHIRGYKYTYWVQDIGGFSLIGERGLDHAEHILLLPKGKTLTFDRDGVPHMQ